MSSEVISGGSRTNIRVPTELRPIPIKKPLWILVLAATVVTYANSLPNGFHYDDWHGIVFNPTIRDLQNIPRYFIDASTFSLSHHDDWRPLLQITYALNFYFGGLNPTNFRLFNLAIHIASALLIYAIVSQLHKNHSAQTGAESRPLDPWMAPAAAFLFALHPANSEVVNYVWARSSLLASFFYLLGFYCFLRVTPTQQTGTRSLWHTGALSAYVLGLATKATVITLPATLFLYEILQRGQLDSRLQSWRTQFRAIAKRHASLIIIGLTYVGLRIFLLADSFGRIVDGEEITQSTYFLSSLRAWVHYLVLFLWPSPLLVNSYTFGWSHSIGDAAVLRALGVLTGLLAVAWNIRRSEFIGAFFLFWFFLTLLPEQSFLPLSEPINGYRPYPAYAGLAIAIPHLVQACGLSLLRIHAKTQIAADSSRPWRIALITATLIFMLALALRTAQRNRDWRTERSLWSDVLQKEPNNPRANLGLGLELFSVGESAKARSLFDRAIALAPKNSYAHFLRGYLYEVSGQNQLALKSLTTAVELNPRSTYALYYRGELLAKMEQYAAATQDFEHALTLKHAFTDARYSLAMVYLRQRNLARGKANCELILEIDRRDVRAYRCIGKIFMDQRDFANASKTYERGLAYLPSSRELWQDLSLAYAARGMFIPSLEARQKAITVAAGSPN